MPPRTALENTLLDKVLRNENFTVGSVFASLHTSAPGKTGANEVSGGPGPYARQPVPFDSAVGGLSENSAIIDFPDMPGVTVGYVGMWDAKVGGSFLGGGALESHRIVNSGDTFHIDVGKFKVEFVLEAS
jgi:hypothetical protein